VEKIYSTSADLTSIANDTVSLAVLFSGKKAMAMVHETGSGKIHEVITEGNDHLAIRGTQLTRFLNALNNFAKYQNIKIATNGIFNIVPNKVFSKENASEYLAEILGETANKNLFDDLKNVEAKIAYIPDEVVVNSIRTVFPTADFINSATPLIDYTLKNKPGNNFCLISKIADELDIIVLKDNKLQIANRFDGTSKENALYYTLNVLENIEFDPRNTYIYLTGNTSVDGPIGKLMKRYGMRVIDFPIKELDTNIANKHTYYKLLAML